MEGKTKLDSVAVNNLMADLSDVFMDAKSTIYKYCPLLNNQTLAILYYECIEAIYGRITMSDANDNIPHLLNTIMAKIDVFRRQNIYSVGERKALYFLLNKLQKADEAFKLYTIIWNNQRVPIEAYEAYTKRMEELDQYDR